MRTANATTPTPVCSPARASLFTGLYPSRHGIHDWIEESTRALRFLPPHRDGPGRRGRPFFLCVGYVDTHGPHRDAPDDLVALYARATFRADLAAHGELDDTLVVYTSDHGLNAGHHGLWEKGNITTPRNFLNASIRVPCTLAWPNGGLRPGAAVDVPVNHGDLHATVLDAAGLGPDRAGPSSPGRSYLPWLRGQRVPGWRTAHVCEYGNARMIRTREHKLIRRHAYARRRDPAELYDLVADPRETMNRFGDPALHRVVAGLTRRRRADWPSTGNPVPPTTAPG